MDSNLENYLENEENLNGFDDDEAGKESFLLQNNKDYPGELPYEVTPASAEMQSDSFAQKSEEDAAPLKETKLEELVQPDDFRIEETAKGFDENMLPAVPFETESPTDKWQNELPGEPIHEDVPVDDELKNAASIESKTEDFAKDESPKDIPTVFPLPEEKPPLQPIDSMKKNRKKSLVLVWIAASIVFLICGFIIGYLIWSQYKASETALEEQEMLREDTLMVRDIEVRKPDAVPGQTENQVPQLLDTSNLTKDDWERGVPVRRPDENIKRADNKAEQKQQFIAKNEIKSQPTSSSKTVHQTPVVQKPEVKKDVAKRPEATKPEEKKPVMKLPEKKNDVASVQIPTPKKSPLPEIKKQQVAPSSQKEAKIKGKSSQKSPAGEYSVEVYSTPSKEDADDWIAKLRAKKLSPFIKEQKIRDVVWYKVRFGKFATKEEAKSEALKYGFPNSWIDRIK